MELHLNNDIFNFVRYGNKRVEIRLYDDKRRTLKEKDELYFIDRNNEDNKLKSVIDKIEVYKSFEELVDDYSMRELMDDKYSKEELLNLLHGIYMPDEIEKYGVCAISFILYEKSCGIVVFNDENKVLLVKHIDGHTSFPKGHVELYETELDTAHREVKEETNIDAKIIDGFRHQITYSPKQKTIKDVVFFIGTALNYDIVKQDSEVSEAGFYTREEANELIIYKDELKVLDNAYDFMKNNN